MAAESRKAFFLVGPAVRSDYNYDILFIYETTEEDLTKGRYTAYHRDKEREEYWNGWLKQTYYPPHIFVNRFGYREVTADTFRGEEHFGELLGEIGITKDRETVKGKSMSWVDISTKDFLSGAPTMQFKEGGYTKPELRNNIKNRIMAGSKGGKPGQWSARKAQLVAMAYRKAGGGYRGNPRKTQRSLKKWTREKWTTSDGKPAIRKGGTRRYLPASAWSRLTPAQRAATNSKKTSGSRQGNQFVANTRNAAEASKKARD